MSFDGWAIEEFVVTGYSKMMSLRSSFKPFFVSSLRSTYSTKAKPAMESIGVLMTSPMNAYLERELSKRCNLFRFWTHTDRKQFLAENANSIRAIVGSSSAGADADLINALPKLEIVSSFSVGLDKIDLVKCKEKGIRVTNTPDVLTDDVADLAIGLTLAVLRRIPQFDQYVKCGKWKKAGNPDLKSKFSGKRVGIIGLGRIGVAIAQRAEAFNCPISYHSRTKKDSSYTYYDTVVELASNSDILVVACTLTPETRHIVNKAVIDALGPKGVLINIGRGPHVDEPEMVKALVEGRLGGAGLDVFEQEPSVPQELFGLENVVLVPHIASATVETRTAMADLAMANLEAYFSGKPLLTPVV